MSGRQVASAFHGSIDIEAGFTVRNPEFRLIPSRIGVQARTSQAIRELGTRTPKLTNAVLRHV